MVASQPAKQSTIEFLPARAVQLHRFSITGCYIRLGGEGGGGSGLRTGRRPADRKHGETEMQVWLHHGGMGCHCEVGNVDEGRLG